MCKYMWDELVIEVTRRCNMACAHCLRGEDECVDMSFNYLAKLASVTACIDQVCFTGGEPSLAVMQMRFFRELCQKKGINVYSFYVVTNGKQVSQEFLMEMLSWYSYCIECGGDPEACGLALSKDQYHEPIPERNEQLLRGLSFFREDKFNDYKYGLLDLGRARGIVSCPKLEPVRRNLCAEIIDDDSIGIQSMVTLTVHGDLLTECDYEYDDTEDITVGNITDLAAFEKYVKEVAK